MSEKAYWIGLQKPYRATNEAIQNEMEKELSSHGVEDKSLKYNCMAGATKPKTS